MVPSKEKVRPCNSAYTLIVMQNTMDIYSTESRWNAVTAFVILSDTLLTKG